MNNDRKLNFNYELAYDQLVSECKKQNEEFDAITRADRFLN